MTLLSRSIELLLDRDPSQVPGEAGLAARAPARRARRDARADLRAPAGQHRGARADPGAADALGVAVRPDRAAGGRRGGPRRSGRRSTSRRRCTGSRRRRSTTSSSTPGARQVRLEVDRVADGVRLRVIDDGRGFDPSAVPDGHLGLAGMRSRAERLGGRLTVTTALGEGTTVEVVVPETVPEQLAGVREDELRLTARRRARDGRRTSATSIAGRPPPANVPDRGGRRPARSGTCRLPRTNPTMPPTRSARVARSGSSSWTPTTGPARASWASWASATGSTSSGPRATSPRRSASRRPITRTS